MVRFSPLTPNYYSLNEDDSVQDALSETAVLSIDTRKSTESVSVHCASAGLLIKRKLDG